MQARADQLKFEIAATVQEFAGELLRKLYPDTPYQTGQARANWQVSLGSPTNSFIQLPRTKEYDAGTVQANLDNGLSTVQSYKSGDILWIVNNAPYIQQLNEGSSKQAPAGFVEQALDSARSTLKGR